MVGLATRIVLFYLFDQTLTFNVKLTSRNSSIDTTTILCGLFRVDDIFMK